MEKMGGVSMQIFIEVIVEFIIWNFVTFIYQHLRVPNADKEAKVFTYLLVNAAASIFIGSFIIPQ
jgi:hypothetical protein